MTSKTDLKIDLKTADGAVIPRATYRLQLHADFDFDAARAVLPYLARLGISHVYCSPISRARPGSRHGYDVTDPARINPELGGEAGFERFSDAALALGMGLLLDQVPNHMGVFGADNVWWMDVLENGQASPYAGHFDIDWDPPNAALTGKLLVPVLGATYGDALDNGEIQLNLEAADGVLVLRYHEHRFPLDPRTYLSVLRAAAGTAPFADTDAGGQLATLAAAFGGLPRRETDDPPQRAARINNQRLLQQRLAQLLGVHADALHAVQAAVEAINTEADRAQLHALHEAQAYRMAYWRMAADEINYRRFFDVNDLAALRIEDEAVFEAVQGTAMDLAASGRVDGFRIDHPDGLRDPAGYFNRLQQGVARRRAQHALDAPDSPSPSRPQNGAPFRPFYVVAEKIIAAAFEEVPTDWALHGTTGYRFAVLVNGLFVERRHADRMQRLWRTTSGEAADFAQLAQAGKRLVARGALAAQLTVLTHQLQHIALRDRRTRDYSFNTLRDALVEVAAALPVYRSYVAGPDTPVSVQDRRFIDWATAQARKRSDTIDAPVFDFIRRCLLAEPLAATGTGQSPQDDPVRQFAQAFQQFSAPVAAKGVEDTAFYRYHRLISLNEVGGDPGLFGTSAAAFHAANAARCALWPHTMLATSTHDNKRAEDVRNRINVLSERPAAWRMALTRWRTGTRNWRIEVDGLEAPSASDQYLLHQTLLGSLPAGGLSADALPAYAERIAQYMVKAAREAKQHTAWAHPNEAYEAALLGFVKGLLGRLDGNPVLADLQTRATELAWYGALNSLAVTVLKFCAPGVPDIYQGTELIDLSLVDPDNRRPVDYVLREGLLQGFGAIADARAGTQADAQVDAQILADLAADPNDGRLKLWLIWRLLMLRQAEPALFSAGDYTPLRVAGARRRHVVAFARRTKPRNDPSGNQPGQTLLVVVARKFTAVCPAAGQWPLGADCWGDTRVMRPAWLAPHAQGTDVLSLRAHALGSGDVALASLFEKLPFAVVRLD